MPPSWCVLQDSRVFSEKDVGESVGRSSRGGRDMIFGAFLFYKHIYIATNVYIISIIICISYVYFSHSTLTW